MLPPSVKAGQIQQLTLDEGVETGGVEPQGETLQIVPWPGQPSPRMLPIEGRHLSFPGARVAALPICPRPARRSAKRRGWQLS